MSNVFETLVKDVETVGKDAAHVIATAVEFPSKAVKVIATVIQDKGQLQKELLQLATLGQAAFVDGMAAASAKGLNWQEDTQTVQAVEAFGKYFKDTFVPAVEQVYTQIVQDEAVPGTTTVIASTSTGATTVNDSPATGTTIVQTTSPAPGAPAESTAQANMTSEVK